MAGRDLVADMLLNPDKYQGEMKSYTPPLRDKIAYMLAGNWLGDDREGVEKAKRLTNIAEFSPLGIATTADDVTRAGGRGDYLGAGTMLAMAMVPGRHLMHGSPNTALKEILPSTRGPLGPGVYTTPAEQIAKRYAGDEGRLYSMPKDQYDVYTGAGYRDDAGYFGYKKDKERLASAVEPEMRDKVLPIIDNMGKLDGYPLFARLSQAYGGDEAAQNLFKRAGFDGLSGLVDGPETLLFEKQGLQKASLPTIR